jgi:DNA-binding SARP family transcriptional activator
MFGTFLVEVDGIAVPADRWQRRGAAALVKILALSPRLRAHQEQVTEWLWPGAEPASALNNLAKVVHAARHALEPGLANGSDSRYLLRREGQLLLDDCAHVDVVEFERLAAAALGSTDASACTAALGLYDDDLLPADRFAAWSTARREELRRLHLALLLHLADRHARAGEPQQAIARLRELVRREPASERAHRELMTLLATTGARAEALRQFELCREALRRELDAAPEAATRAVYDRIVAGQAAAALEPARPTANQVAPGSVPHDQHAIAVLPFHNRTGDGDLDWLANGLAETLIRGLSRQPGLRVMAPSTVLRYRGREVDAATVGRELGVDSVVLGRIERVRDRTLVGAEFVATGDGALLWGDRYERGDDDLFAVEAAIGTALLQSLAGTLGRRSAAPHATSVPSAFESYLRGRHEWNKRTGPALRAAIAHFEAAIAADPACALAHAALADCYGLANLYLGMPAAAAMSMARQAALQALELDSSLAEAYCALAYVAFRHDFDFSAAERDFRRAIDRSPSYATAHQWLHELLTAQARFTEQREVIRRAQELDPLSPIIATEVGFGRYFAREFAPAIAHLQNVVALHPQFAVAWLVLGLAELQASDAAQAVSTLAHAAALADRASFPLVTGVLGHAEARAGRTDAARDRLAELAATGPGNEFARALVCAGLRHDDDAIDALETAAAARDERVVFLGVEPMFDGLSGNARFRRLRDRIVRQQTIDR